MELIRECFEEYNSDLTKSLLAAKFSIVQARQFLPEAASGIFECTQKTGIFQTINCLLSDRPYQLLKKIDVEAIAKKSGINPDKVAAGLYAIAPVLLQAFSQRSNGAVSSTIH